MRKKSASRSSTGAQASSLASALLSAKRTVALQLFQHVLAERIQTRLRRRHLRTIWIFSQDLAPRPAFIMKLFLSAIESEDDALPVIAIEAAVIQVVTKLRRAAGRQFTSFKSSFCFPRQLCRGHFSGVSINQ